MPAQQNPHGLAVTVRRLLAESEPGILFAKRMPPSTMARIRDQTNDRNVSAGTLVSLTDGISTVSVLGKYLPNSPGHSHRTPSTRSRNSYTPNSVPAFGLSC